MERTTVVAGGFASYAEQYGLIAALLQEHYGSPFMGANFSSVLRSPEQFACAIHESPVIAHSGGSFAVKRAMEYGAVPTSLSLIAPSIPEKVRNLIWRGALIQLNNPAEPEQLEEKVTSFSSLIEMKRHPVSNARAIPQLARFSSLYFALSAQRRGVDVSVCFMDFDGLFDLGAADAGLIEDLRRAGVALRAIHGTHSRFTANPVETLKAFSSAPEITTPIPTLDPAVSFRRAIVPTLGSLAARLKVT